MPDNPFAADDNPYQAPMAATGPSDFDGSDPDLDRAAFMLRQTKPWVRFMSVMMFIGSTFMVLAGLFMMLAGAAGMAGMPGGVGPFVGIIYIAMALIYILPGVFLWMYADRIGRFLQQRTPGTLAAALESQKSFWKFVGIFTAIILCLYAVLILVAIAGGIASSM